jgi:hypothetical protein
MVSGAFVERQAFARQKRFVNKRQEESLTRTPVLVRERGARKYRR